MGMPKGWARGPAALSHIVRGRGGGQGQRWGLGQAGEAPLRSPPIWAQPAFAWSACLYLSVSHHSLSSLSRSGCLPVSPRRPQRLCLGAWHTLAAVLPPPVSCPPGTLPPLVYRSWKNPLASRRPKSPRGGEEASPGVGTLRGAAMEDRPPGAGPEARVHRNGHWQPRASQEGSTCSSPTVTR